jgi:UDP-glucose 4-epimerase
LVERLLTDGREVVVIDDCSTGRLENLAGVATHPRLRVIQTKVSECGELEELARGAEAIYHLAAAVGVELVIHSPIRTIETNLREAEAVMSAAGRHGTPVLLASTSEVYGKSQKTAFSEEDDLIIGPPHLLRWSYACSKLMDEFLAMSYARERQLPVTVVRFFNTVGPRQTGRYGMVLPRFIAAAKNGAPLKVFGDGRQTRCFCLVTDVVEALTRLQRNPAAHGQVFNVGTDEEVSVGELAALVISVLGSKSSVEMIPYGQAYAPGFEDMLRRRPLIDKLERVTGFRPATRLREIIEVTARTI